MQPDSWSLVDCASGDERSLLPADDLVVDLHLTEDRALCLIRRLADHFGIVIAYWSTSDIELRLTANDGDGPGPRHLTTAEWNRVTRTPAWHAVADIAYDNVVHSDVLSLAVRQAGLECAECGAKLCADLDVAQTWGLCDTCRARTTAAEIVRRPCVADAAGHHERRNGRCEHCGVPMPHQAQQRGRAADRLHGRSEPSVR